MTDNRHPYGAEAGRISKGFEDPNLTMARCRKLVPIRSAVIVSITAFMVLSDPHGMRPPLFVHGRYGGVAGGRWPVAGGIWQVW